MSVTSIIEPITEDFKILTTGQLSHTITESVTKNTFHSITSIDVSRIPLNRIYPLIYCTDKGQANSSTRDTTLIPDVTLVLTSDGTAGGLASGESIVVNAEWRISNSGILYIGYTPPNVARASTTENLKAPYSQPFYIWYILYI